MPYPRQRRAAHMCGGCGGGGGGGGGGVGATERKYSATQRIPGPGPRIALYRCLQTYVYE